MKSSHDLVQQALPLLMEVPKPRYLADELVRAVDNDSQAIELCFEKRVRRFSKAEIAESLGIKPAHLSKVFAGTHKLDSAQKEVLQHLCSNYAIKQFAEMVRGEICEATESPAEKIARLEQRVAHLEGRAAA